VYSVLVARRVRAEIAACFSSVVSRIQADAVTASINKRYSKVPEIRLWDRVGGVGLS